VASDGNNRYLALWTSYIGGANSYDLFAQRYVLDSDPLAPPSAPIVTALSSSSLSLTWPAVQGLNVVSYGVYADDAASPAVVTNNLFTVTNLAAGSTHHYKLDYLVPDGRRSPFSPTSTNRTYNAGTYGGIPYEWMAQYFGDDWPAATADSDGDGVSNQNEFLAGTDPTDATSVLRTRLQNTQQGVFLYWNTQPGLLYQVQASTSMGTWSNLGGPRFAAGYQDSLYVGGSGSGFYRIVRLR
jgi:hypothetical protein